MLPRSFAEQFDARPDHVEEQSFAAVATFVKWLKFAALHGIDVYAISGFIWEKTARHRFNLIKSEKKCDQQDADQYPFVFWCHIFSLNKALFYGIV